jgi:hypothetical protein
MLMATVFLSVIVPMGLLATFRLTGVLREPPSVFMTTVLDTSKCEFERPDSDFHIPCRLNSFYENDIELNQEIDRIMFYRLNWMDDSDHVSFILSMDASAQIGFAYSVNITMREEYENSLVYFDEIASWPGIFYNPKNLTLADCVEFIRGTGTKAFMTLVNANLSKSVHFDGKIDWVLESTWNMTHSLEVELDVVYYNGTVYQRIVQPFSIKITHDDNNSFQTATEINEGNYSGYIGANDPTDCYKITLTQGQRVNIYVNATSTEHVAIITVSVYRPGETNPMLVTPYEYWQNIEFTSDAAGYWIIEIQWVNNCGFYSMEVNK